MLVAIPYFIVLFYIYIYTGEFWVNEPHSSSCSPLVAIIYTYNGLEQFTVFSDKILHQLGTIGKYKAGVLNEFQETEDREFCC